MKTTEVIEARVSNYSAAEKIKDAKKEPTSLSEVISSLIDATKIAEGLGNLYKYAKCAEVLNEGGFIKGSLKDSIDEEILTKLDKDFPEKDLEKKD